MKVIWIVGRYKEDLDWEILGIYSTEQKAIERCKDRYDFVWKVEFNKDFPEDTAFMPKDTIQWPLLNGEKSDET